MIAGKRFGKKKIRLKMTALQKPLWAFHSLFKYCNFDCNRFILNTEMVNHLSAQKRVFFCFFFVDFFYCFLFSFHFLRFRFYFIFFKYAILTALLSFSQIFNIFLALSKTIDILYKIIKKNSRTCEWVLKCSRHDDEGISKKK